MTYFEPKKEVRNNAGEVHNLNGPAQIWSNGDEYWYLNGLRHRENGPAVIAKDGTLEWYVNGEHHRADGPAIIRADGDQEWYLNDKDITKEVRLWIEENNFSDYSAWSDAHRTLFRLKF